MCIRDRRGFEPSEAATRRLHAEADYTGAWLELFDQIVRFDATTTGADHPVLVNGRYVMAPSPIPRFDNLKLNQAEHLSLIHVSCSTTCARCEATSALREITA